ncbi:hypothetical protein C8R46DRAFT_1237220 [Mycena filopes]|nr:hypothetical protein C8R46DRAFT_1237220 [Mycena filopes]
MPVSPFSTAQRNCMDEFLPEYIQQLDAGATTHELTKWKQALATRLLAEEVFANLNFALHPRPTWFEMIVRKYTNYYHQVYKKSHPDEVSASKVIKANPLLKFRSVPTGRQLFARDMHTEIMTASKQHILDKGTTASGAYQLALKAAWDALDDEEVAEWDAKAEEECGDIGMNQAEFNTNIQQALRGLCRGGIVGDAEMVLFYAFRSPKNGDLKAGSIHAHSKHNKTMFGGAETQTTYGIPWAQFADAVIPRPVADGSVSVTVASDGTVLFPTVELDSVPPGDLRHLVAEYFDQCWLHKDSAECVDGPPWDKITLEPASFYDMERFSLPFPLKEPQAFTIYETLAMGQYLSCPESPGFQFKAHNSVPGLSSVSTSVTGNHPSISGQAEPPANPEGAEVKLPSPPPKTPKTPAVETPSSPITPLSAHSQLSGPRRTPTPTPPSPSPARATRQKRGRTGSAEDEQGVVIRGKKKAKTAVNPQSVAQPEPPRRSGRGKAAGSKPPAKRGPPKDANGPLKRKGKGWEIVSEDEESVEEDEHLFINLHDGAAGCSSP